MIFDTLSNSHLYEALHPRFKEVFDYVKTHDLLHAPSGRITLDGVHLFINVDEGQLKSRADQLTEIHRRYIDIQIPLLSAEEMGWRPLESITEKPLSPFDEASDRAFYHIPSAAYIPVRPGEFTIFFPTDAHAPAIGEGPFKKLIAKVEI